MRPLVNKTIRVPVDARGKKFISVRVIQRPDGTWAAGTTIKATSGHVDVIGSGGSQDSAIRDMLEKGTRIQLAVEPKPKPKGTIGPLERVPFGWIQRPEPSVQGRRDETFEITVGGQREAVRVIERADGTWTSGMRAICEFADGCLETRNIVGTGPTKEAAMHDMLAKHAKQAWDGMV